MKIPQRHQRRSARGQRSVGHGTRKLSRLVCITMKPQSKGQRYRQGISPGSQQTSSQRSVEHSSQHIAPLATSYPSGHGSVRSPKYCQHEIKIEGVGDDVGDDVGAESNSAEAKVRRKNEFNEDERVSKPLRKRKSRMNESPVSLHCPPVPRQWRAIHIDRSATDKPDFAQRSFQRTQSFRRVP